MAWIPLLLASWIVVDVLIVAIMLAVARRRRHRLPSDSFEPVLRVSDGPTSFEPRSLPSGSARS